jgi:hypothetical protein
MSHKTIRWSGLCLFAAALLLIASRGFDVIAGQWTAFQTGQLVGALLLLFGLVGWYSRQSNNVGLMGLIGFALAFIGTAVFVGFMIVAALVMPAGSAPTLTNPAGQFYVNPTAAVFLLYAGIQILGFILLSAATMRAKVPSRWAALLVLIGIAPTALSPVMPTVIDWIGRVLFSVGIGWLGWAMFAETDN